jgi:hypothetical protein
VCDVIVEHRRLSPQSSFHWLLHIVFAGAVATLMRRQAPYWSPIIQLEITRPTRRFLLARAQTNEEIDWRLRLDGRNAKRRRRRGTFVATPPLFFSLGELHGGKNASDSSSFQSGQRNSGPFCQ